jgi:hypothetical protein
MIGGRPMAGCPEGRGRRRPGRQGRANGLVEQHGGDRDELRDLGEELGRPAVQGTAVCGVVNRSA